MNMVDAMELLGQKMETYNSVAVTYRRGAHSCTWHATIGKQLLRTSDRSGNTKTEMTERDFVGPADELILNGSLVEPEDGDTIDVVMGSRTRRFTVSPIGNEKSWYYADEQGETTIRVHTKHTSNV